MNFEKFVLVILLTSCFDRAAELETHRGCCECLASHEVGDSQCFYGEIDRCVEVLDEGGAVVLFGADYCLVEFCAVECSYLVSVRGRE